MQSNALLLNPVKIFSQFPRKNEINFSILFSIFDGLMLDVAFLPTRLKAPLNGWLLCRPSPAVTPAKMKYAF